MTLLEYGLFPSSFASTVNSKLENNNIIIITNNNNHHHITTAIVHLQCWNYKQVNGRAAMGPPLEGPKLILQILYNANDGFS